MDLIELGFEKGGCMIRGMQIIIASKQLNGGTATIVGRPFNEKRQKEINFKIILDDSSTSERISGKIRRCPFFRGKSMRAQQITDDRMSITPINR